MSLFSDPRGICAFDDKNSRLLQGHFEVDDEMTIQMCLKICRDKGYEYAGLEWQYECYCGDKPDQDFEWAWPEKCNDRCSGDLNQNCGGSDAISIWKVPPRNLDGVCILNSPATRSVLDDFGITGHQNLTVQECQIICEGTNIDIDARIFHDSKK